MGGGWGISLYDVSVIFTCFCWIDIA